MLVQILLDNPNSWMVPYSLTLKRLIENELGINVNLCSKHHQVVEGEVLILLSCVKVFCQLHLNKYNLVVHESKLPLGRGMSPATWQILSGCLSIPVALLEASEGIDEGDIYETVEIKLNGTELVDEWRLLQFNATKELIFNFLKRYPNNKSIPQKGSPTYYPARTLNDSKLDINKTILEQFNLLRVCDNDRYPAWFELNGTEYTLKIFKR